MSIKARLNKKFLIAAGLIGALLILSSCGPHLPPAQTTVSKNQHASYVGSPDTSGNDSSSAATAATSGSQPTYLYSVGATGYTQTSVQVATRTVLKVRFTPGIANIDVPGSGYTAAYSQLGVFISVGGNEQATPLLSNGLKTAAESSPVLDFSNSFTKTCDSADTSCRQFVTITVLKPNDDYWCMSTGYYCPYSRTYDTHPWNGKLEIQTDDTRSL